MPGDLWVGKTIFCLRPMPNVKFDPVAQMIAVEPEGKGRKHSYSVYAKSFATARECPRPNPQDLKHAMLWAQLCHRVVQCMSAGVEAGCD